ncbi:hypothetical protein FJT64_012090 [Amphibalanus amphitrite]|uniref:Uncharacterized protein n=1 Tax=Amphibalanus amphitrite TaxID=1232801 RepID=A0A6A4VDP3_AMPAM|nr:hypothetical protein FJT64_012090 [Amphibalanus amphitrite]
MASTAYSSQFQRQERRTVGQPSYGGDRSTKQANWDDHLDGLLTDLKQSLPPGRGPSPQSATRTPLPPSADLSVPTDLPGSEDYHERREYTSPDQRTHTIEERSGRTERIDGGAPSPLPPPGPVLHDVSTATTEPPPAATTINYHIYNYGSEVTTDSGVGTLERGSDRRWGQDSLDRSLGGRSTLPGEPAERLYTRSVTTEVEKTASRDGPAAEGVMTSLSGQQRADGGLTRFPVDSVGTVDRCVHSGQTSVRVPSEPQFHSKEKSKEGNKKSYFEASGKYKASGGSKQKEDKGGKTIPICLPCCAGAACVIM